MSSAHSPLKFLVLKQKLFVFTLLLFSHCRVQLFATPWTAARQASLSFTISQILFKLMSIESVMPSNHLALCHSLLLLPSIFPSIRVFSLIPAILSGSGSSFSLFLFGDEVLLESLDLKDLHLTCFPWGFLLQNYVYHEAVSL